MAVVDIYLLYSLALDEDERVALRTDCGRAWNNLRKAGPGNNYAAPGDRTELEELSREAKLASVREFLEFFPFETVRDGTLGIEDDLFMECLINAVKNETISYQIFVIKKSKKNKANLIKRIEERKKSGFIGDDLTLELEGLLNKQVDLELRD